jgi:hypothetical protein
MTMTEATVDIDDSPCPSYPWSTFEKIGEFFYLFSILDKWTGDYLTTIGGYSDDRVLKMVFDERLKRWKSVSVRTESCCSHADALYIDFVSFVTIGTQLLTPAGGSMKMSFTGALRLKLPLKKSFQLMGTPGLTR